MNGCEGSVDFQNDSTLIIRQPIFPRDKDIWGYELISNDTPTNVDGGEIISLSDLINVFHGYLSQLSDPSSLKEKRLLLDVPKGIHLQSDNLPEGWKQCVFGLCQTSADSSDCQGFAKSIQSNGGCLVFDDSIEPDFIYGALLENSDIIKISLAGKTPPEIVNIRRKYKGFRGKFLVTGVNSWEAFEGTRALGFSYFQGPFFTIPQVRDEVELPASSVAKLQLLRELGNPDCEMDELAEIIASDVSLSYRILKYINSVFFELKNKIKSIQQAVSLLGLNEVRHWITVVVMSDLDSTPKGEELSYIALQRGRFLSKLTESMKEFEHSSNTMFMLGLFSKLDALLSYPMDKALEDIPLDDGIKDGLCGTLNEFRDWLLMLDAVEIGNWGIANEILGKYGACFTTAATQYMKAASWAAQQLPNMKG